MKIVLDTNVWLSGVFWEGEASRIIEKVQNKKIEIIISNEIISEIIDVLNKESKFQRFLENKKQSIEGLIRTILSISKLIKTKTKVDVIKKHPSDNVFLEAAIDGKADYVVSYNKHLLNIKEFRGIKVIAPSEFLRV